MEKSIDEHSSSPVQNTSNNILLRSVDLSHSFDYLLFENVSLQIEEQKSIAVLGVSGSGKSTLLHILATLLKPKDGQVFYKEQNLYDLKDKEILDIRREDIGIIFQSHYLFKGFSAAENLEISSIISEKEIDETLVKKLKIEDILEQNVSDLSGGQQQRVSIARVLVKKPKIIFADEPTGNLDKETATEVMDTMFEYIKNENAAIFLVTHDEELAKKCDHTYKLKNKRLVPLYL